MIRPTAAAMPPSVIMLKLLCRTFNSSTVAARTTGTLGPRLDEPLDNITHLPQTRRALLQNRLTQLVRVCHTVVDEREVKFVMIFQTTHGTDRVGGRKRLADVGQREAMGLQPRGI